MSITVYSELQTALSNWGNRADLTSRLPEFIVLAEAKMNRKLRTKDMEIRDSAFPIGAEFVGLPRGFGGVRSFYTNTSPKGILELMASDILVSTYADGKTGIPRNYAINSNQFQFGPPPDAAYTGILTYFLKVPALGTSGTATANWVLTDHPDAYVYGGMAEMSAYLKDYESAKSWATAMYEVLDEIKTISNIDRWSGGSLVQRPG